VKNINQWENYSILLGRDLERGGKKGRDILISVTDVTTRQGEGILNVGPLQTANVCQEKVRGGEIRESAVRRSLRGCLCWASMRKIKDRTVEWMKSANVGSFVSVPRRKNTNNNRLKGAMA